MGSKSSAASSTQDSTVPEPVELPEPWRQTDCNNEIVHEVTEFKPSNDVPRIMLYGPVGAGKSSFVNSVQRVLLGRNAMLALENATSSGTSFTKNMNIHKLKKKTGDSYPLEIIDTMGVESAEGGIQNEDIIKALQGNISDEYTFNPVAAITDDNPKYKKNPSLCDKVHCLVFVLAGDVVSIMEDKTFDKMKDIRNRAGQLGIPQVLVMTRVDKTCLLIKDDLKKMYYSKKIKEKVKECSIKVGVPLNAIYPVKNYAESITQDLAIDMFILTALRDILNFANDYVECQLEKKKELK